MATLVGSRCSIIFHGSSLASKFHLGVQLPVSLSQAGSPHNRESSQIIATPLPFYSQTWITLWTIWIIWMLSFKAKFTNIELSWFSSRTWHQPRQGAESMQWELSPCNGIPVEYIPRLSGVLESPSAFSDSSHHPSWKPGDLLHPGDPSVPSLT